MGENASPAHLAIAALRSKREQGNGVASGDSGGGAGAPSTEAAGRGTGGYSVARPPGEMIASHRTMSPRGHTSIEV